SGFVDVRGAASDRSDWDLVVFDAASRRVLASSESFGSHEVAQSWVGAGQRLAIQGCRRTGKAKRFALTIHFLDLVPPKASGTPMLVRVPISGPQDVVRMDQLGLDVTEDVQRGRAIVHLDDAGQTRLLTQ